MIMTDKRLIDANAYIKEHCKNCDWPKHGSCPHPQDNVVMCYAVKLANEAPTIDAVEVVHGRWVIQRYYGGARKGMVSRIVCDVCNEPNEETNYCPNCGAKMDGDGNG